MSNQITNTSRLITVVRRDLNHGYQTAQTAHAVAEWSYKNPRTFRRWRKKSGYLICLSVRNLEELNDLVDKLCRAGCKYTKFFEPDIGQVTAIAINPNDLADKLTKGLQLANIKAGTKDKRTT